MRLSWMRMVTLPAVGRLRGPIRRAVAALGVLGGIGCSAAVVDADRTAPTSRPVLLPPEPVGSANPDLVPVTIAPMSIPAQPAEAADTNDDVRHVPIDSVFQPRTPLEQTYHEVKAGESLSAIAKRYGTTAGAIQQSIGLDSKAVLTPGQMLFIPK